MRSKQRWSLRAESRKSSMHLISDSPTHDSSDAAAVDDDDDDDDDDAGRIFVRQTVERRPQRSMHVAR